MNAKAAAPVIVLKAGREKSIRRRHPWVFSGAIEKVLGDPQGGDTVLVRSAEGQQLGLAAYSPQSQIRGRMWTYDASASVDAAFLRNRLKCALDMRERLPLGQHTNAMRLVHSESDGLPGLIVDRYADVLVAQFLSAGMERWREDILDALVELTKCEAVFERSDAEVRTLEGLPERAGFVRGNRDASRCAISEHGLVFRVDVAAGQKTGFFLDQRANRLRVRELSAGREVLDCFCYSGGFAISSLAGGAKQVTAIDSSETAIKVARENLKSNALDASRLVFKEADVFLHLRELRNRGAKFDLIVLDPPKFAPTAAQVENASRAYKDINLLALKLLSPGGLLATFSCSGGISADLFQKIIAGAALDAGADAKIIERFGPAADHPVALEFPEGDYLKGLLVYRA
ncbi:MAG: class I SAM-dependent rRNA methyltransferase [Proteobacteria bacterium]|nr:class I SAM-dependent rRNA methyltransferase [Pseudomonadota bacterium]